MKELPCTITHCSTTCNIEHCIAVPSVLSLRTLELRSRGLNYREVARELGYSVFKVYQLIPPYESPRSRVRRVHKIAG